MNPSFIGSDLTNVFFSDFYDKARIAGRIITGKFHYRPREFEMMSGTSIIFEAPFCTVSGVRKGDLVIRDNDKRKFVVHDYHRENDMMKIELK